MAEEISLEEYNLSLKDTLLKSRSIAKSVATNNIKINYAY
jgi:hypothetical protein